ncbi:MAG: ATP-binding cassette domain-containing protein [Candidatus Thorarchaeota archaeon]
MTSDTLLHVENLTAVVPLKDKPVQCIDRVTFSLGKGQTLGVIGERESGKSSLLLAILGLFERVMQFRLASAQKRRLMSCRIPPPTQIPASEDWIGCVEGSVLYKGVQLDSKESSEIAFIPEDNRQNVTFELVRIERDMGESLRRDDFEADLLELRDQVVNLFGLEHLVERAQQGFLEAARLKAGEFRKIGFIEALMERPELLIVDEPTDMLTVTEQRQVIEVLRTAKETLGFTCIITSQDATFLTELADRVAVIYAGRVVEVGDIERIIFSPSHPYTKGLMSSNPAIVMMQMKRGNRVMMKGILGVPPDPTDMPSGCTFNPRCEVVAEQCKKDRPEYREIDSGHWVACHNITETAA